LYNSDRQNSFYLALVEEKQTILAAAIHIPGRKLFLSKSTNIEAVRLIAEDLAINSRSIAGITASQLEAKTFVAAWQDLTEQSVELEVVMPIQQLKKTNAVDRAVGKLRLAMSKETELLTDWIQAFVKEALGVDESEADSREWVVRHLKQDGLYVWKNNNRVVSMAACGGRTPHGIRVKSVYTPPEYRGNGYATSCVATMSQLLLKQHKYCFLFTDLANLASNKMYRKIGYMPMGQIENYKFS